MPKLTLLEMTQDILSDMDSDNVNSISDTIESLQVAQIIETTYYELLNNRYWPHSADLIRLEASGTASRPTHMKIPDVVTVIHWIKYDKRESVADKKKLLPVEYIEPVKFVEYIYTRDSEDATVQSVTDPSNIVLLIKNDRAPTYWTSFDDEWVVMDSFNSDIDSTLQSSKTVAHGEKEPTWTTDDSFVPDLPVHAFPMLLAEAKSVCFSTLKQAANPKAEQQSSRQRRYLALNKSKVTEGFSYPNYGRKK